MGNRIIFIEFPIKNMHKLKNFFIVLLMMISASLGATKAYLDHRLHSELDTSIHKIADKVTIEYTDIYTSLLGSVIIDNLHLTTPNYAPIQIDTVTLYKAYQFYDLNTLPQLMQIAVKGVQFQLSDTAPPTPVLISAFGYAPYYLTPRELRGLGYAHLKADIDLDIKSQDKKVSLLGNINAYAWGELQLSVDLNNLPAPALFSKAKSQIQLTEFMVTYTNKRLVNQIFTWLAQRNKMAIGHFKQTLMAKLKKDVRQARLTLDASVLSSIEQFIKSPTQLTIHLQPSLPITINTLFKTSPKHLGLKLKSAQ
jgi:hypothetical protein